MVRLAFETEQEHLTYIVSRLRQARTQPAVRLAFKNGDEFLGAITFVERLGTGRLINVDDEFSLEFAVQDLKEVRY